MKGKFNKYRHYLEDFDLTDDQKDALLATVYGIVEQFVDRGFYGQNLESIEAETVEFSGVRAYNRLNSGQHPKIDRDQTGRLRP